LPNAAPIKSIKKSAQKLLCFSTKNVGENDPEGFLVLGNDVASMG
jgi:hypothetical protein